jgi:carboxyl-terminal processing protease
MDAQKTARSVLLASAILALGAAGGAVVVASKNSSTFPTPIDAGAVVGLHITGAKEADAGEDEEDDSYSFRLPSGLPAELSCEDARLVVAQVRTRLAYEPEAVSPHALSAGAADWLDPHGLWSAAPDSPIQARIDRRAEDLVAEMESRVGDDCPAARELGGELAKWVAELREKFDVALAKATDADAAGACEEIPFDAIAYSRPARSFAEELGGRVGSFQKAYGASVKDYVAAARDRFFPNLDADEWGRALLAAAVRAYVPLVDPHGAWAPLDEEESVYEVDLASRPPPRLWDKSERTAVGVTLGEGASAPLAPGDTVLAIAGVTTAGLPLEQLDQLSFAAADLADAPTAVLLRKGDAQPRVLVIEPADAPAATANEDERLPVERVAYGDGDVAVIAIHDVRDDLGDLLGRTIDHERQGARPTRGVILDLRGDGGGSTDGAISALGLFIPGARLFPMKRRDGTIETDRAPEPPVDLRWTGPVATLIDGETASAAEMMAGALAVYRRGPSMGTPTYGKGCAQEYLDDEAHAGVLRLTTLLYALPDGAAVQRVGLTPTIGISFAPSDDAEREATLAHAPPTWRGPDVRDRHVMEDAELESPWPPHGGATGPCKEADLCKALYALGVPAGKNARATRGGGKR